MSSKPATDNAGTAGNINERLETRLSFFAKNLAQDEDEVVDPAFILVGNVPDYSHRLPDTYNACVPLGSHGGYRIVYYCPRMFDVDEEAGELRLHDGGFEMADRPQDAEFTVSIDTSDIITSRLLHGAGYTGPPFEEV